MCRFSVGLPSHCSRMASGRVHVGDLVLMFSGLNLQVHALAVAVSWTVCRQKPANSGMDVSSRVLVLEVGIVVSSALFLSCQLAACHRQPRRRLLIIICSPGLAAAAAVTRPLRHARHCEQYNLLSKHLAERLATEMILHCHHASCRQEHCPRNQEPSAWRGHEQE